MIRYILALLIGMSAASAQEQHCYVLDPQTSFCGRPAGWKGISSQPLPGTFTFENQEFIFAITVQANHGHSITPQLYDLAMESMLQDMDTRHDIPDGTHRPETLDVINHKGMEGRRLWVPSQFEGIETHFMIDILFSDSHAWTTQTAHIGAITSERLARVHHLVMEDLHLDP